MNNDKILIILEQLVKSIEDLKKRINTNNNETRSADFSSELKRFDGLEEYQILINKNLVNLGQRFKGLEEEVNMWEPVNTTMHHHEHVFFPGILAWLDAFKRWKVAIVLSTLLTISILLIFEFNSEKVKIEKERDWFHVEFLKYYRASRESMSQIQLDKLYLLDRNKFIREADSLYNYDQEGIQLERKINRHESELKELKILKQRRN